MTQDCFVRPADPDMCYLLRWKLKSSSWHQSLVRLHFLLLRLFFAFSLMYIWTFPSNFFKEHGIAFVPVLLLMNIKLRWELLRVMFQSKSGNLCSRLLLHSNNLILMSRCKQPQMCLEVVGADEQLHSRSKKSVLRSFHSDEILFTFHGGTWAELQGWLKSQNFSRGSSSAGAGQSHSWQWGTLHKTRWLCRVSGALWQEEK